MKKISIPGIAALLLLFSPWSGVAAGLSGHNYQGLQGSMHDQVLTTAFWRANVDNGSTRDTLIDQAVCHRNQPGLQEDIQGLALRSQGIFESSDVVYSRIQAFYAANELNVSNYEEALLDVELARINADATVNEVKAFEFELDCNDPRAGRQLAGFRQSVILASSALTQYREELVQLILALQAESDSPERRNPSGLEQGIE